jgi:4-hydroxybenzoate polyprenyltransferase
MLQSHQQDQTTLLPVDIAVPLFVDLDNCLIQSDTLWEGWWLAIRTSPLECLRICLSLLLFRGGRAVFKRRIAVLAPLDPQLLPYRSDLIHFLSAEAKAGRTLILATAADELVARDIAAHVGLFTRTVASDGVTNRKGKHKLFAMAESGTFIYIGDSPSDLQIWPAAIGAIVVGNNKRVLASLRRNGVNLYAHFPSKTCFFTTFLRAIRVHQWPKNVLVILPILLGHRASDPGAWGATLLAMGVFSLAASIGYILNDLIDIEADRKHHQKRTRPFASGEFSIPTGFVILFGLCVACFGISTLLPNTARLWVIAYVIAVFFYSSYLKTRLMADAVGLAGLYALRVIVGGAATGIVISPWTLAFCLFFFYSLALAKRFGELRSLPAGHNSAARRGYHKEDYDIVGVLGVSSGLISAVVFSLYISSPDVRLQYSSPTFLWLACPLIVYWFGRLWILANRGVVSEDPLLFSLKDRLSYCVGIGLLLIWLAASRSW